MSNAANPVRFHLVRDTDVSGISGTGTVAAGVVFEDGAVAMRWLTNTSSVGLYDRLEDVITIHGHNGATRVLLLDPWYFRTAA